MRWLHKTYANVMGYFWIPCPSCGEMFGGHETPTSDDYRGLQQHEARRIFCPKCAKADAQTSPPGWHDRILDQVYEHMRASEGGR
jgi:hypothetical protein